MKKRIALLGLTGSIGRNTLDVLRAGKDYFEPVLFSCHRDYAPLLALAGEYPGALLALSGAGPAPDGIYSGREGLFRAIAACGADLVVNGISGAAGLEPSLAALEAGADLALANKETLVMASSLVFAEAERRGRRIIPVDSEHAALFNLLGEGRAENTVELLLTASGGPFRKLSAGELEKISPADALRHPTWNMGPKITVDSATMANKGLEVIEAAALFSIPAERITVVIHPQSIVHSMVRFRDGTVHAELAAPDMRLPIHRALHYPACVPCEFGFLDFRDRESGLTLEFEKPDPVKFPLLPLAYEAARRGGAWPVLYNAANEEAVAAFLAGKLSFLDIGRVVDYVLKDADRIAGSANPPGCAGKEALALILELDRRGREAAGARMGKIAYDRH
ncbi:MAG: 1-deoxy-D-xylulose-5-phosphate reductoisomerase [Spirochaetaceae bacterium]|nr:1-deoxy-D-xylulose-5-phosphate reductoisomerase [Spirochaetaceae bacterium]